MKVFIAADHRGFELKEFIKNNLNITIEDYGAFNYDPEDDYVDFALEVAKTVANNKDSLGILICGSGAGMCLTANKVKGIRAALGCEPAMVKMMKEDDDINILCLASDFLNKEKALEIVKIFLSTTFKNETKYLRRISKIENYENKF